MKSGAESKEKSAQRAAIGNPSLIFPETSRMDGFKVGGTANVRIAVVFGSREGPVACSMQICLNPDDQRQNELSRSE